MNLLSSFHRFSAIAAFGPTLEVRNGEFGMGGAERVAERQLETASRLGFCSSVPRAKATSACAIAPSKSPPDARKSANIALCKPAR